MTYIEAKEIIKYNQRLYLFHSGTEDSYPISKDSEEFVEACNVALRAINTRIPRNITTLRNQYDMCMCGAYILNEYKYCPECGQKIGRQYDKSNGK